MMLIGSWGGAGFWMNIGGVEFNYKSYIKDGLLLVSDLFLRFRLFVLVFLNIVFSVLFLMMLRYCVIL